MYTYSFFENKMYKQYTMYAMYTMYKMPFVRPKDLCEKVEWKTRRSHLPVRELIIAQV